MSSPISPPQLLKVVRRARADSLRDLAQRPLQLSLTADALWRYPGEPVTLFVRLDVLDGAASGVELRVTTPPGLRVERFHAPTRLSTPTSTSFGAEACPGQTLIWQIGAPGAIRLEVEIVAVVAHDLAHLIAPVPELDMGDRATAPSLKYALDCVAEVRAQLNQTLLTHSQGLTVDVPLKARYLKHLPGIYESDELMSRLLMLFESFWAPIEQQITHLHYYFDPRMTPARLLPWLAAWADWAMDERWPEDRQRRLVQALVSLYRWRGTPRGLRDMLALYTGLDPDSDAIQIVEHRASNFVMGPTAYLGPGVALGTRNIPHTFSVRVRLPPLMRTRPDLTPDEVEREEARRRQVIEEIIEMEKPAHTRCDLQIAVEDEA